MQKFTKKQLKIKWKIFPFWKQFIESCSQRTFVPNHSQMSYYDQNARSKETNSLSGTKTICVSSFSFDIGTLEVFTPHPSARPTPSEARKVFQLRGLVELVEMER